jgi:hypothetical protein
MPGWRERDSSPLGTVLAIGLALLSSFLFALAAALQQREAATLDDAEAGSIRMLLVLVRRPLWLGGVLADTGGFVAVAAALAVGRLVVVQPLIVTVLLFALPLSARLTGRRRPRERLHQGAHAGDRRRGAVRLQRRAHLTVTESFDDGLAAVVEDWPVYALVAVLVVGTWMQQASYQAGALQASLPAITGLEPVVGIVLGLTLFDERFRVHGPLAVGGLLVAMLVAGVAVVVLARARAAPTPRRSSPRAPTRPASRRPIPRPTAPTPNPPRPPPPLAHP